MCEFIVSSVDTESVLKIFPLVKSTRFWNAFLKEQTWVFTCLSDLNC